MEYFAQWLTFDVFNLTANSALGKSVEFFLYDTVKILFLMIVVTHLMGTVRYFFPPEKIKNAIPRTTYGGEYILASSFGAITPFCSCSSIPLFVGLLQARIAPGVAFAFLITSPLINEIALALLWGIFGWQVTLFYLFGGMGIGIIGGWMLGKIISPSGFEVFLPQTKKKEDLPTDLLSVGTYISGEAFSLVFKLLPYILIGIAVGAVIHGYVPAGYFENYLSKDNIFAVPISVLLAVPMYANASSVIPVLESLIAKGVPLGTALSFMMAIVGLSLPEAIILRKVLKPRTLALFFLAVTVGIILIGYGFNAVM